MAIPSQLRQYGVRDVERLLHIPRNTLRALVAAGFVKPARGVRPSAIAALRVAARPMRAADLSIVICLATRSWEVQ